MASSDIAHHLPNLQPIGWLGVLLTVLAIGGYGFKVIRTVMSVARRANDFFDAWNGEPARPGFPARPGIPERVAQIEAQLRTNGGLSLRDQTNRIEQTLKDHILASGDAPH